MTGDLLLSFIVLSHNYENYIATTISSILDQTIKNFEIIIVDDASTDHSREVIQSFDDDRIRLLVNDKNLGGAATYNRAVGAAHGRYLVNLDADDWIAPNKVERQLAMMSTEHVDISCTYAHFVDTDGNPHPQAEERERLINQPHAFNSASSWIGCNNIVRSTTMVDRAAHLRIGLDDPGMVRAPDYELWTRALRAGCRFGVLPEALTFYRLHPRGVTFGDPTATFRELCYAMLRNVVPVLEAEGNTAGLARVAHWMVDHGRLTPLPAEQWHRLLGMLLNTPAFVNFNDFMGIVEDSNGETTLGATGRRLLAVLRSNQKDSTLKKLESDVVAISAARDFWQAQVDELMDARNFWKEQSDALMDARDFWKQQSDELTKARDYWHQQSTAWQERSGILAKMPTSSGSRLFRMLRAIGFHRQG